MSPFIPPAVHQLWH